jgi:hypothetical protein
MDPAFVMRSRLWPAQNRYGNTGQFLQEAQAIVKYMKFNIPMEGLKTACGGNARQKCARDRQVEP